MSVAGRLRRGNVISVEFMPPKEDPETHGENIADITKLIDRTAQLEGYVCVITGSSFAIGQWPRGLFLPT